MLELMPTPGQYVPTGHSKQVAAALIGLYVPAAHGMHTPIVKTVPMAHTFGSTIEPVPFMVMLPPVTPV